MKTLRHIGTDSFYRPVYEDQHGQLWKDIGQPHGTPDLHSVSGNTLDGEPEAPLTERYTLNPT